MSSISNFGFGHDAVIDDESIGGSYGSIAGPGE